MTYASGGLIQAADYNGFAGGSAGANVSGQINTVWSTGQGNAGYGQTAVANVSAATTVTAAQWASLINTINGARKHQAGAGYSNISVPTSGTTITYLSTVTSELTNAYTNRLTGTTGSTTSFNRGLTLTASAGVSTNGGTQFTITFSTVDQCRYFFNAGGYLVLSYNSSTNTGGTARGTSLITLSQTNFSSKAMRAITFGARAGSGGTLVTDTTTLGYYGQTTSDVSRCTINSTSYYTGDYFEMRVRTNGTAGSYGANGNIVYITPFLNSSSTGSTQPADSINVNIVFTVTAYYPATTYLTNSWGTVTIA